MVKFANLLIKFSGKFSEIRMSKFSLKNQQIKVELQALRSYYISKKTQILVEPLIITKCL
jgi:hypothetical protein